MKDLAAIQKPHFQHITHVYDHAIHAGLVSSQMTSWVAQLLAKKNCCWPRLVTMNVHTIIAKKDKSANF